VNYIYTLNITLLPDGFIYYAVNSTSQDKISSGLLSDDFSTSGDIYLDDDASSDLNLNYGAGYLTVVNPNFVAPDYANVTLFNMMNKTIHDKVFYINKKVEQDYWFNISSTKKPLVTARWDNGTELPSSNFFETVSGDTFAQYQLNWTPVVDGAFALFVKAVVDDKETVRKYLFAVGSVVYALQDMNHPQMMMKKVNSTAFSLSVLFRNETDLLQPFSLPCGSVDLDLLNASVNISKVYAYDKGVQVWRAGVPSEFHTLDVGRGYVMRLKDHVSPLLLNVICSVPTPDVAVPDYSPLLKYPTLKSGWNLVGIGGYESLALDSFDKLLSAGKEIVVINETVDQMKLANGAAFKPGVAYWVKVN